MGRQHWDASTLLEWAGWIRDKADFRVEADCRQGAIEKHIPCPLLAAAQDEFGAAAAFRRSGLIYQLALLSRRGPQLQHLIARPSAQAVMTP